MMEISFQSPKTIQATHFSLLAYLKLLFHFLIEFNKILYLNFSTFEVFGKLIFQPVVSAFADSYGYKYSFNLFLFCYIVCLIFIFPFSPKMSKILKKTK